MQENGGARLWCILLWKRKFVLESSDLGQNGRLGDKGSEPFVQIHKDGG